MTLMKLILFILKILKKEKLMKEIMSCDENSFLQRRNCNKSDLFCLSIKCILVTFDRYAIYQNSWLSMRGVTMTLS